MKIGFKKNMQLKMINIGQKVLRKKVVSLKKIKIRMNIMIGEIEK